MSPAWTHCCTPADSASIVASSSSEPAWTSSGARCGAPAGPARTRSSPSGAPQVDDRRRQRYRLTAGGCGRDRLPTRLTCDRLWRRKPDILRCGVKEARLRVPRRRGSPSPPLADPRADRTARGASDSTRRAISAGKDAAGTKPAPGHRRASSSRHRSSGAHRLSVELPHERPSRSCTRRASCPANRPRGAANAGRERRRAGSAAIPAE